MTPSNMAILTLLALLSVLHLAFSQAPVDGGADDINLRPFPCGTTPQLISCKKYYREIDGTCTNDRNNEARYWGSAPRAQNSYNQRRGTSEVLGKSLRSPREISNILSAQPILRFDERGLSEMFAFFGQFIAHNLAAIPLSDERFDIPLTAEDSLARDHGRLLGNESALPFRRSVRAKAERRDFIERPMNSVSSALDLSAVYGSSKRRNDFLRSAGDSMMRVSDDGNNLLPKNTGNFNNAPSRSRDFFIAGDHRANQHPVLTALHIVFVREHNRIVREINKVFKGDKEDGEIYRIARKINEAQFQRIVYEEWLPALIGRRVVRYKGFRKDTDITTTTEFTTAALRFVDSMIGNEVKRKGPGSEKPSSQSLQDMFYNAVETIEKDGIDDFLRGALTSRAQKVDLSVVNALRNGLFKLVPNENVNYDVVALNIQRGRDHAIANYNGLRKRFCCVKALNFSEISKDRNVQSRLQTAYPSVSRVEAWPGLMAEDHPPGSSVGTTLSGLLRIEFTRIRNGDRFFYRAGSWPKEVFTQVPLVRELVRSKRLDVFRRLLGNNTDIGSDLPKRMFFVD